jgi:hypothetical protein
MAITTVHVLRPGHSKQNAPCGSLSSRTETGIAGCMQVIPGLEFQRLTLRLSHNAAANTDHLLLDILLISPYAHPRGQVKEYGLYMVKNLVKRILNFKILLCLDSLSLNSYLTVHI